ncbi:MAG: hypothetical protein ACF8PN_16795 [Phycisphaerales bacterium]
MSQTPGQPVLRLVGATTTATVVASNERADKAVRDEVRAAAARRDLDPNDPRWLLAVRTKESLQGAALSPDRREQLLRFAERLGLRLFDANLVIAVVQDEARRGSSAGRDSLAERLRIVPAPRPNLRSVFTGATGMLLRVALTAAAAAIMFGALMRWLNGV